MKNEEKVKIASVNTVFEIIEILLERGGARPSEVAEETERALSTVHDHLSTLQGLGYVAKQGDRYHASLRFLGMAERINEQNPKYDTVRNEAEEITNRTGLDVDFLLEENGRGVYLLAGTKQSNYPIDPRPGDREYLHSTAAGKAILAELPPARVESILDRWGLPAETENTTVDRQELMRELETVAEQGYALNDQENKNGLRAVSATIKNPDGTVLGGVSVTGPTYQIQGEIFTEEMPKLIKKFSREIESKLQQSSETL
jgi:DNA-binding IclR family transcriptional regulator